MTTNAQRLRDALEETLRLQNPESDEYKQWLQGPRSSPLPPSIPAEGSNFYPTTDRALVCVTEIIDNIRANDTVLARTLSRDEMFKRATSALGVNLPSLVEVVNDDERWKQYREALTTAFTSLPTSQTVYVPVWLFIRQEYGNFSVGSVEFVDRSGWLDKVEHLRGCRPAWRSSVEATWGLGGNDGDDVYGDSDPRIKLAIQTVTRFAAVEQRIACVAISGFDDREAKRRALLATRIAIDGIRLLIPGSNKKRIFTSADHGPPRAIERLRQTVGHDLTSDSGTEMPGVGGKPGAAQELIDTSTDFRIAAGNCITVIISPTPVQESLPELSHRWSNAIHWYGRACVSDADFVALPMFGFTLDTLCGGKEEAGIRDLACALFEKKPDDSVRADGLTLKAAVRKVYEWRSKIAHGSLLAVDLILESERVFALDSTGGCNTLDTAYAEGVLQMKQRPRIYYTESQKAQMWERWQKGESLQQIAQLFDRNHSSVQRILAERGGIRPAPRCRAKVALTLAEREEISRAMVAGHSMRSVATRLGRAPSTISREINRNGGRGWYRASGADQAAWDRASRPKTCKLAENRQLANIVAGKLQGLWSPQQIAGWLKRTYPEDENYRVSHETIYRSLYIQARGALKKELLQHLRRTRAMRRSRHHTQKTENHGRITDTVSISERPATVEDRAVPGHWEGDLLFGDNTSQIATLVERHTRYVMLVKIAGKDTETVISALIKNARKLPQELFKSLTWDRGKEMAAHKRFTLATDIKVYFCDPHSPWQRGSNENTNGLLRQYFPKGIDISGYSQAQLNAVARKLNGRPRKTLNYETPAERFSQSVASTG